MAEYLEKYGIKRYLNAFDTVTVFGASRMAENTKEAMDQVSRCFVDILQMQRTLGEHVARRTKNEAAYICNGAAGGVQLCAAVCMAKGSDYHYQHLPDTDGCPNEFLVLHAQHNTYDKAIETAGGKIVLVGDADEVLPFDLEGRMGEKTAGVFYCPASIYQRGSLPLSQVAEMAHRHGIPVIVDAAAQLPPMDNLWRFSEEGADMVIFSGGKTLCGPQASGLIVGKKQFIEDCIRFGAPMHGVCRSNKVSREGMIGLAVAIDNYLDADHEAQGRIMSGIVDDLVAAMAQSGKAEAYRVEHGSVGQSYPRAFGRLKEGISATAVTQKMREAGIFIGCNGESSTIYFSPLNLTETEAKEVCAVLSKILADM